MTRYRVVRAPHSKQWAVEECVAGGPSRIVGRFYVNAQEAHTEAARLSAISGTKGGF
jgi:hypothetical protein